jgi:AraC family transcriptional regulator
VAFTLVDDPRAAVQVQVVERVIAIIRNRHQDHLTLAAMGTLVGRSPWHLNLTFRKWTHLSIHEYVTALQMANAVADIRQGVKIEAVALLLGYRSPKSFYRQFEHFFAAAPSTFRALPPGAAAGYTV